MKKKTAWTILLCIFLQNLSAQDRLATGRIRYEQNTRGKLQYVEMFFNSSGYEYSLRNRPEDLRYGTGSYTSVQDSVNALRQREKMLAMMADAQPPQFWYGQLGDSIVLNTTYLMEDKVVVADTLSFVAWELLEDTMTINGLSCQKAIGKTPRGDKLEAWFAPSIPVAVAPFTLRGLPGLMLRARLLNGSMETRLLELEWPLRTVYKMDFPERKKAISRAQARQKIEAHNKEALQLMNQLRQNNGQ